MDVLVNALANADVEEKLVLLPRLLQQGERGIDYLIDCLNDRKLAIRVKAYELLQNISSQQVQQAIASGILLHPGDRIYSVYQSGICFTDQDYLINEHVSHLKEFSRLIYGRCDDDSEDPKCICKRVYCYVEQEQAERKAEALHQEILRERGIGVCGFEWRKENPDFDAKKWCLENDIPYPDIKPRNIYVDDFQVIWKIKEFIWDIEDENLEDKFRRSRYIYHPKHIDTWCDDNKVDYDPSLDNWDNYRQVMNYLHLPENIDLLSKFWKDGVGHFAFARKEIVQDKIYLKVGENLKDLSAAENKKLQWSLKPENYPQLASKYLISIIESDRASIKHKLKAQELLQDLNIDTEEAKEAVTKQIEIDSVWDMGESIVLNRLNTNYDDTPF